MRLVFMATGEIAEPTFEAALASHFEVVGLVTQPDRPVGKKQILTSPRVKELALAAGIPVIQPEKISEEAALAQIRKWQPEIIVVVAYGQILSQSLIEIPSRAIINLHASLLPKYRGASCIQAALLNGDTKTGWSVIHVVKKLDAGNIIHQKPISILDGETGGELHDRLAKNGPAALLEALGSFESGDIPGEEQDEGFQSYVPKLERRDGIIDWTKPAEELERLIRAYHPWPGTTGFLGGKRLKIFPPVKVGKGNGAPGAYLGLAGKGLEISCGQGSLILEEVQLEGSRRMTGEGFARGREQSLAKGLE